MNADPDEDSTDPAEPATEAAEAQEPQPEADQNETPEKPGKPDLDLGRIAGEFASRADRDRVNDQVYNVIINYNGDVNADGATFGVGGAGPHGGERKSAGKRKVTGRLSPEDISAAVDLYAEPPCFADAVAKLQRSRVVVLEGQPGTGRRAGAVNLLRQVTRAAIVVLSPLNSLKELSEKSYVAGQGYLVIDQVRDPARADLEFTWSSVKEQLHAAGAYLVITNSFVGAATKAVPHITWDCPPPQDVLRAQLAGRPDLDDIVRQVTTALADDASLTNLVAVARGIRDEGLTAQQALLKLDETAERQVLEWFAGKPDHREVTAAAALCFLEGTDVRTFEILLERLHEVMAAQVSGKRAKAAVRRKDAEILNERETWLYGTGLLDVRDVPRGGGTAQQVVFKDEAYRRHVLAQLWNGRTIHFWDAIRQWLTTTVEAGWDGTAVASGLALLACRNVDEVQRMFLQPWSAGEIRWPGQVTATYVLWCMCQREGLQAVALQTAVRWAQDKDLARKWTAALAFGGELGVYYPSDAVNQLWQLASQKIDLWLIGCTAMASLFATLRDEENSDPGIVLSLLSRKMTDFGTGTGPKRGRGPMPARQLQFLRNLTMSMSLAVLAATSFRTGRPAVAELFAANPERMPVIAQIWAGVLIFRPLRWEAFYALRQALHALRDISDDPTATAREFGIALAAALPERERHTFKDAFVQVDEQVRRGRKEPLAEVLVACLDAIAVKIHPGGAR